KVVFAEQFAEAGDGTLLVLAEVKVDVPLKIIAPEILVKFLARFNDALQRFHAELLRLLQFTAQFPVFDSAPQRPYGINKRQLRHFQPGQAKVENFVRVRGALKFNRPVADEQDEIFFGRGGVIFQRLELRFQSTLGQQDFQQVHAGERGGVAENFPRLGQRFFVREQHAVNFAERGDGDAVEDVIAVVEQDFGEADERGVE